MSVAAILAALGLAKSFACESQPSNAAFLTRDLELMHLAPPSGAKKSAFKINVSDSEVIVEQIEGLPIPQDFRPFEKIKDKPVPTFYSSKSSFVRAGTAEPTMMTLVMLDDDRAILLSSMPIAITEQGRPDDYLPALQIGRASCSAVKVTK